MGVCASLTLTPRFSPVSESWGRLSHFQPPATVTDLQFLDPEGSAASGRGRWGWASRDILFLAPVGGNVFHVFPRVYRAEGTECSLWPRKLAWWGLASRVCFDQHVQVET